MKNVLLICSAGITSSLIVSKMKDVARESERGINVWSAGVADAKEEVEKANVVLLSPPAAYLIDTFVNLVGENGRVKAIPKDIYNIDSAQELIDFALEK